MNLLNLRFGAAALLALSASSAVVAADEATGFYAGLAANNDTLDLSVAEVEDATSIGLLLGYRFAENVGIELATGGGEHEIVIIPGCAIDISTAAIYGAFRTTGKVYLKGKMGLLSEDVTSTAGCPVNAAASDTGMSYGLGGGVRMGKAAFEVEYTLIEADVSRLSGALLINF
jgi:hypothetical protein